MAFSVRLPILICAVVNAALRELVVTVVASSFAAHLRGLLPGVEK